MAMRMRPLVARGSADGRNGTPPARREEPPKLERIDGARGGLAVALVEALLAQVLRGAVGLARGRGALGRLAARDERLEDRLRVAVGRREQTGFLVDARPDDLVVGGHWEVARRAPFE